MGYSVKFTFFTIPLTLNEVISKHWRSRHNNFKKIHREIVIALINKKPAKPILKAKITVTRYSWGSLDRDNAYFTCKPILDTLVKEKVLIDDKWENVDQPQIIQVKIKKTETRKIEVLLEEIE
ncbi:MAG: hypothetical protein AB7I27_00450 [Bacteriovoracaceae bacterium]